MSRFSFRNFMRIKNRTETDSSIQKTNQWLMGMGGRNG